MSPPDNKSLEKSIRNLAQILLDTGLTEIEVDSGETRIRVARNSTITQAQITPPPPAAPPPPTAAPIETKQASPPTSQAPADEKVKIPEGTITSPMVGTVYLSSEPGAAPFVSVGDQVKKGQTILIIEAMKTMNHISATREGSVKDILVADAQAVEFGQPLIVIS